jgi:hypothetical protein
VNVLDLVKPSQKDLGSGQRIARRYVERVLLNSAAANLSINSTQVSPDQVRFIHTISISINTGAAQTFNYAQAILQDGPSSQVYGAINFQANYRPVAAETLLFAMSGLELVVMAAELVNVQANFTGGAAANQIACDLFGWEFPRGNLQR